MSALVPLSAVPDVVPTVPSHKFPLQSKQSRVVGAYKLTCELGSGGFGSVRLGALTSNPKAKVAVKVLKGGDKACEALCNEAAIQVACHDHPNIPTCFDLLRTKNKTFLVMEQATNGDLFDLVSTHGPLSASAAAHVLRQIASAAAHMHAKGLAHRDIKPENVLLSNDGKLALLCDFGHAVRWTDKDEPLSASCGTVRCLPPEMFLFSKNTCKRSYDPQLVDAFGLGNALFFMLTGYFPFEGADPNETARNITEGTLSGPFPTDIPDECADLLLGLLAPRPKDRCTVQQAVEHPFLAAGAKRKAKGSS